jgi:hypothetical protein
MVYASKFRQLTCDISWGEATLINEFQFGLQGDVKDLLLTLLDPSTLSEAITQVVQCDNKLLEHQQKRCRESTSTKQRNFAPPTTQENFSPIMPTQPLATSPKDDPMHIDKTRFKPLTK